MNRSRDYPFTALLKKEGDHHMEVDQILKQVGWLDEERRKDKNKIGSLEERISALEATLVPLNQQMKEISGETTRLSTSIARVDDFDEALGQTRLDTKLQLDNYDKEIRKREEENERVRREDIRLIEGSLAEIRKEVDQIAELKRNLRARMEEETRLSKAFDEIRISFEGIQRGEEESNRTIKLMEDGRRQDSKRITDVNGELSSLRQDLASATIKKLESRMNEFTTLEMERRTAFSNLVENQSLRDAERERVWKEWQARFQIIESQATDIETTLQNLDTMQREVKRAQQTLQELSEKVERRINEMTEMQRLTEERFRQEWTTFKVDDQKRWTNYTLTTEEQRNEIQRQHDKLSERATNLEDTMQETQDLLQQMNELTEKTLQSLLAILHESVTTYERTIGRSR
jgi:chromosome segregation ATPase